MGTRGIVAIVGPDGRSWEGVYNHWDSYPTSFGKNLWETINREGMEAFLARLNQTINKGSGNGPAFANPFTNRALETRSVDLATTKEVDTPYTDIFTNRNYPDDLEWVYLIDPKTRLFAVMLPKYGAKGAKSLLPVESFRIPSGSAPRRKEVAEKVRAILTERKKTYPREMGADFPTALNQPVEGVRVDDLVRYAKEAGISMDELANALEVVRSGGSATSLRDTKKYAKLGASDGWVFSGYSKENPGTIAEERQPNWAGVRYLGDHLASREALVGPPGRAGIEMVCDSCRYG